MKKRNFRALRVALLGFSALLPFTASGVDAVLTDDVHLSVISPFHNLGTLANLKVSAKHRVLLQFDLSTLPTGVLREQIAKATLHVWVNKLAVPGSLEIAQVTSPWTEMVVTHNTVPSVHSPIAIVPVTEAGQWLSVDLTHIVTQWIEYPRSNLGLSIAPAANSPTTTVYFDSKENAGTSHQPRLAIALLSPRSESGPVGPQGAPGPAGAPGSAGATGIVNIGSWSGAIPVTPLTSAFVFLGPTATLTTSANQRITTSASLSALANAAGPIKTDTCYRASGGRTIISPNNGYKLLMTTANSFQLISSANSFVPGAGVWVIGACAALHGAAGVTLSGEHSTGWAMVSNP